MSFEPDELPREGLGILDPGILDAMGGGMLLVLEVVDMNIGGSIVGAGFAFGGSIAESVFNITETSS